MAKPLVTANQVTTTRLLLLPVGTWLMYQGRQGLWLALVLMTLVGMTDILDGWLARRYGPTVLGGLMDPIVDKIFIVATVLPFVDLHWMPAWAIGLLLLREFLVTGLRSAYERRGLKLATTLLAKIKTWVQMAGAGVICIAMLSERSVTIALMSVGAGLPLVLAAVIYLWRRKLWRGAFIFSGCFAVVLIAIILRDAQFGCNFLIIGMLAVTWISGWGYLSQWRRLLSVRPLDGSDFVRVATAALPLVLLVAAPPSVPTSLMLNVIIALEMAAGGLDNLLCHHQAQSSALGWGLRVGLTTAFVTAGIIGGPALAAHGLTPEELVGAALGVSAIGTVAEFIRGRSYYLEDRFVERRL